MFSSMRFKSITQFSEQEIKDSFTNLLQLRKNRVHWAISRVGTVSGVARTQGLSLIQMSGGQGSLSSEGGVLSLRVGTQVYHQGDFITLEPNSPMTIDGPNCREGPRSRLYAGAMQMTQGPNPHLPAIEFLINP